MPDKILIADDEIVNRKLLANILKKENCELIEAGDGDEAIELTLQELPDLILLDIMMPGKDGYEVCHELKRDSRSADIPIIFFSARGETEDKIKGLELGGVDYLTKPFDKREVLARVKAQLKIQNLTKALKRANNDLIRKQKRIDENLKAGAEIQRSLMAINPPDAKTIDVVWRFMPCQRIGGDIFNILRLDEDHWAIYMLDVSGHGITSSMVAVSVSQMLQPRVGFLLKKNIEKAPYYEIVPPTEVLNEMDREYPIERFDKFFTISYCILNVKDGTLRYSNAGHPPPVLLRKDGSLELLNEGGTIIGMGGLIPFEEGRRKLCSGDKLFLYTDGIAEYQNEDGLFYDEDRFFAELKRLKDRLLSNIIDGVIESMMSFGNNTEPQDDISLLAVEFRGQT
jgi:sigma-B regulation protein RsbU (phosphoserine phosphatase)